MIILGGEGYSLIWPDGAPIKKYEWHEGSMVVPPENWWHQHFNAGAKPARYLALRAVLPAGEDRSLPTSLNSRRLTSEEIAPPR